ncbi:MAG: BolA family protein [bacterium]|nr:BolA family protein [bacterium]
MASPSEVKSKLESNIDGATAEVEDLTGQENHYSVRVTSAAFSGKSMIEQHQMVYAALGAEMKEEIHALTIATVTP